MANMVIKVLDVSKPENKVKGKNAWSEIVLTYTGDKGQKEKKFPSYVDIYPTIKNLTVGSSYEVTLKKEGDFWQWTHVEEMDGLTTKLEDVKVLAKAKIDWDARNQLDRERFEFEKEKQVIIVRQSSLANAISMGTVLLSDVIEVAGKMTEWALTGNYEFEEVQEEQAPKRSRGRPKKEVEDDLDGEEIE